MNLIDKDLLLEQLNTDKEDWNNMHQFDIALGIQRAINRVKQQQIVEERKHGHWVEDEALFGCWFCSNCNKHVYNKTNVSNLDNYCPKCGAIMGKE